MTRPRHRRPVFFARDLKIVCGDRSFFLFVAARDRRVIRCPNYGIPLKQDYSWVASPHNGHRADAA